MFCTLRMCILFWLFDGYGSGLALVMSWIILLCPSCCCSPCGDLSRSALHGASSLLARPGFRTWGWPRCWSTVQWYVTICRSAHNIYLSCISFLGAALGFPLDLYRSPCDDIGLLQPPSPLCPTRCETSSTSWALDLVLGSGFGSPVAWGDLPLAGMLICLGSNNLVVISLNFKSALGILFASSKAIDDAEKILNSLGLFSAFFSCQFAGAEACWSCVNYRSFGDVLHLAPCLRKMSCIFPRGFAWLLVNAK